ncbi:MAG TPA: sulfatase-like hydrolase/transferase [Rubrobacter sp.]|nr:sulfatase-like hydrolase/transferase [Rubrobacter sp.]
MTNRTLTRRDFLKVAGAGTAGVATLGAAGCGTLANQFTQVPEEYLPSGGSRMNVVLVIIDSLRKDHVGAYGSQTAKTPNLDEIAKDSLLFTRAHPEAIPSIPARRGIHTGFRTFPFRDWQKWSSDDVGLWGWQPIPRDQTTLAETLAEEGFYNLFVTDTLHQFRPFYDMHRGFHAFHFIRGQERDLFKPQTAQSKKKIDDALIGGPNASHAEEIMLQYYANTMGREGEDDWFAPQVFLKGMEFLEAAKDSQPFFLTVDVYDPHEPWDPPDKYTSMYSDGYGGPEPITSSSGRSDWMTEAQLERMRALYSGEVTMMDAWLGKFMDRAADLGFMENTMFVFLSDHGHAFGEHGYAGKVVTALYPELTDTLFMIKHPGGKGAGKTSDFFVSTHDVTPTILGALGVEPAAPLEGQDLTPLLDGGEPEKARPYFTAGYHDHDWARDDRYAMFARYDGTGPKLFDLENDPMMHKDVAAQNPDVAKKMFNDYIVKDAGGPLPHY